MTIYTPYTYRIKWTALDVSYYGVRWRQGCNPDEFWREKDGYFTSSKYVDAFRLLHGEPDIIEIRRTFIDANSARIYEDKVLRRLHIPFNIKWLNKCISGEKFCIEFHTEETKAKLRGPRKSYKKRPPITEEARAKLRGPRKSYKKRPPVTEETRANMSEAQKNRPPRPPVTEEHRANIREAWKTRPPVTNETRTKLREAWKKRRQNKNGG